MLYPEIPKTKNKPTYIGGGIFALLIGAPCLVLFLPPFLLSFDIVIWDWNNIGLNADYLQFAVQWGGYLIIPALLLIVNIVGLFIGRSRSSFFFKLAGLLFVVSFFVKYGLWFLGSLDFLNIITLVAAATGAVSLLLAFIFRFLPSERKNPNRATSFLMFYAVFWLVAVGIELLASYVLLGGLSASLSWFFPEMLGLFGVVGGLWMISTSRRRKEDFNGTPSVSGYPPIVPIGTNQALQSTPSQSRKAMKVNSKAAKSAKKASAQASKSVSSNLESEILTATKINQSDSAMVKQSGTVSATPPTTPPVPNGQRATGVPNFVPPFPPSGLPPRMPNLPPRMPNLPPKIPPKKQGEK